MEWKKAFAWLPVRVGATSFADDNYWIWLKPYWYIRGRSANSYGAEYRDTWPTIVRRPDKDGKVYYTPSK